MPFKTQSCVRRSVLKKMSLICYIKKPHSLLYSFKLRSPLQLMTSGIFLSLLGNPEYVALFSACSLSEAYLTVTVTKV